jgi:tetratricopeptide (TPR) repeat protein
MGVEEIALRQNLRGSRKEYQVEEAGSIGQASGGQAGSQQVWAGNAYQVNCAQATEMRLDRRPCGARDLAGKLGRLAIVLVLMAGAARAGNTDPVPANPAETRVGQPQGIANLKFRPDDANTRSGFEHLYNLEYDQAVREFELALKQRPDDPFTTNHLLSAVLFRELYRTGALDTELYAKNSFLTSKQFPIDPKIQAQVKDLMERAFLLEEARLKANPGDVDALYARGVTRATRALYIGLVEKAWFAALRNAVGARRDHERVLELDPKFTDAKMVVGIHNYVIGSVNFAVKMAASIVGLSGSKSKGIEYLYAAGRGGGETSVDARIALSLFLRREQRYPEALRLVGQLELEFPRNFLFRLENANLMNAAGHGADAVAAYRKLLDDSKAGMFAESRMEMAYYGMGEALRGQRDYQGAAEAYDTVQQFKADPDQRQRAEVAAGEMYDVLHNREQALRRYQAAIAVEGDPERAALARKRIKQPYKE